MQLERSAALERSSLEGTYSVDSLTWAQLGSGRFEVRYGSINAPPVELSVRNYNVGFKAQVAVLPGHFLVLVAGDRQTKARWFGANLDETSIAATKSSVDISTDRAAHFYRITIDQAKLARLFPAAPDALDLIEHMQGMRIAHDPLHAVRIRGSLHRLFSLGAGRLEELPHGLPVKVVYGTLVPLLSRALERFDRYVVEPSKCLTRRLAAVRSCESYMREHVDATITLLDLSQLTGMRSRSLINAFEAVTGHSPMDYLKRLRLNGVHRDLQRTHEEKTRIIDVATDWGFWHMGHFTSDYRAMFGETPSQTLLRS